MESPIEVVRRFCAAWSDNMGAVELAAFFAEDATSTTPTGAGHRRENIATTIASVLAAQASRASISASSTSQPMVRS